MKIAICLSGYTGYEEKLYSLSTESHTLLDLNIGYEYYKKNVIQDYDVDTYVHSWSVDMKEEILDTYKPKKYTIEKQLGEEVGILNAGYSQWYSRKKSIELMLDSDTIYDWVILSRFDVALDFPFEFEEYDNKEIYLAGEKRSEEVNDLYFMSNMDNMKYISKTFDNLEKFGYNIESQHGGLKGGIHHAVGLYIRKKFNSKLNYLGTDVTNKPDIKMIRGFKK